MNTRFSKDELDFQFEVREFLEEYRDLDGFYCQGHKWPEVRALFSAMAQKNWLALMGRCIGSLSKLERNLC